MIDWIHFLMENNNDSSSIRRSETICCLIGFGIGVGCCLIYRFVSNLLTSNWKKPSTTNAVKIHLQSNVRRSISFPSEITQKSEPISCSSNDPSDENRISDDMTWSEMSSSLSTVHLLQDSYHSSSLTAADSGVDCSERSKPSSHYHDEDDETLLRKYDSDTALHHDRQTATECHLMSYISTEKGLERALEQTTRFYTDLEHIATDLGTLTKRYNQTNSSLPAKYSHRSIDALDWDWNDDVHSPRSISSRKGHSFPTRSTSKSKLRRRLNLTVSQTDYNESDQEHRLIDWTTSPLRRRQSSVYFDSSDEENVADETIQVASS